MAKNSYFETDKLLVDDKTKDTPISITVKRAYARESWKKLKYLENKLSSIPKIR